MLGSPDTGGTAGGTTEAIRDEKTQLSEVSEGADRGEILSESNLVPDDAAATDDENEILLKSDMRDDLLYTFMQPSIKERIKKAPKRVLQHMSYAKLVEDRIADLEQRFDAMEQKKVAAEGGGVPSLPDPAAAPKTPQSGQTPLILGVKRMTFEEYKPKKGRLSPPEQVPESSFSGLLHDEIRDRIPEKCDSHVIDVVVSSVEPVDQSGKGNVAMKAIAQTPLTVFTETEPARQPENAIYSTPERIRINSPLLCDVLAKITGQKFTTSRPRYSLSPGETKTVVILRPFKLLVTYDKEIRAYTQRLADQLEETKPEPEDIQAAITTDPLAGQNAASAASNVTTDKTDSTKLPEGSSTVKDVVGVDQHKDEEKNVESKRCLDMLKVLVGMFDQDFKATFDLRRQIDEGSRRSIAFADLWHLFRHGQDIRSGSDVSHTQIYRILNVTGGRSFLCSREAAGMEPLDLEANSRDLVTFCVQCFHYNTDGKDIGPVQKTFIIKRYDGVKLVTSLPCYPIQFSKTGDGDSARASFIERGKRFKDLIRKSEVVHKRYEGLTLSVPDLAGTGKEDIREEVRKLSSISNWPLIAAG